MCFGSKFILIHLLLIEELIDLIFIFHINFNPLFFKVPYYSNAFLKSSFFILKLLNS